MTIIICTLLVISFYYIYNKNHIAILNFRKSAQLVYTTLSNEISYIPTDIRQMLLNTLYELMNTKIYIHEPYKLKRFITKYTNCILKYKKIKDAYKILNKQVATFNKMEEEFNLAKREYKYISKKYPYESKKYIILYHDDINYYIEHYIKKIKNLYNDLENEIKKSDIINIDNIIESIELYKKSYYSEINSVFYTKKIIIEAEKNISDYENEIKKQKGTLYTKLYNRMNKNNNINAEIVLMWNNMKKDIIKYNKLEKNDMVNISNYLMDIIMTMNKIDILTNN